MKRLLSLLVVLTFFSCNINKDYIVNKKSWVHSYKYMAMYYCLCETTDNQFQSILQSKKDVSFMGPSDALGVYYNKQVDSIARNYAKNITTLFDDPEFEFYGQKALYGDCVRLYESKYLDSIAKTTYKKYKRSEIRIWVR